MKKRDYNNYDFSLVFEINAASPSGIVWTVPRNYRGKLDYSRVGLQAGNVRTINNRQDYWLVSVFGMAFFCHRIIWLLHNGSVDLNLDVDHIDGNSLNNVITNLRQVPASMNARNRKSYDNKEYPLGIYLENTKTDRGNTLSRFRAHYSKGGKVLTKSFSINRLGYDLALSLALSWRQSQIENLNLEGAGYTDRHGT